MMIQQKHCLYCEKPVQGRSDKKFCDDYCRNSYNNQIKATPNNQVRNINNALKKNRHILSTLLPEQEDTAKTTREKMLQQGFQFRYHTHQYVNKNGNVYRYCYDYGYLELDQGWFLLVRSRKPGQR